MPDWDLNRVIYDTIHNRRSNKSVEQLADECGCSPSYLYRAGLDEDNGSGCNFPMKFLIPLMQAQRDFSILHHLAHRTGHLVVKIPRSKALKAEGRNQYQQTFSKAFALLCSFFDDPDSLKVPELRDKLYQLMSETAGYQKAVERYQQRELDLEGEDG
jgi:hypothetical protein